MSIAPQVKDATDAIQQVPSLVDAISGLLGTPTGWLVLLLLFFWLLVNKDFSHLFDIFERKEKRRLEHLDLYVTKPELADQDSIKVLQDLRDAHYFKIATGIYAEKKLRDALIDLHACTSHIVGWKNIRRAFPYIEVSNNGKISIRELTKFEKVGYWYNEFVGYASLLVTAGILTYFFFSGGKTFVSFVWGIGGTFMAGAFVVFVFAQNWPVGAAKQIKKELDKAPQKGKDIGPTSTEVSLSSERQTREEKTRRNN